MTDYKRLTERDEFGNADIIGIDSKLLYENLMGEETNKLTNALNRFAELEDMIEQGLLVKLPCKVGDTVYCVGTKCLSGEYEYECDTINDCYTCHLDKENIVFAKKVELWFLQGLVFNSLEHFKFGKTVFLTKAEAEARLAELKGGGE